MLFRFLPKALALSIAFYAAFCTVFWGCKQKTTTQYEQVPPSALTDRHKIDSLEKAIVKNTSGRDTEKEMQQVLETLRSYQNYSIDYPKDTATADYLLKSGKIYSEYLKDYENAAEYLNRLVDSFPRARQRPMGLLLLGSAYQELGDTVHAMDALHILEREYANTDYNRMAQELMAYIRRVTPKKEDNGDQPPLGEEPKI